MSGGTVSYTINIGANISKVKEAMKEVSQLLSSSNLDKGITSSYERKLGKLSNALLELENKASQPIKTDAELRDVERSIKKVTNLTSELGLSFKELQGKDLSKVFGDFTKPVQNLKDYIKEFSKLEKAYERTESARATRRSELERQREEKANALTNTKNLKNNITKEEDLRRELLKKNIEEQKKVENSLARKNRSLTSDLTGAQAITEDKSLKERAQAFKELSENIAKSEEEIKNFEKEYAHLFKNGKLNKSKLTKVDKANNVNVDALRNQYEALLATKEANQSTLQNIFGTTDLDSEVERYQKAANDLAEIQKQIQENENQLLEAKQKRESLEQQAKENPTIADYDKEIEALEKAKEKLEKSLEELNNKTSQAQTDLQSNFTKLKKSFKEITGNEDFDNLNYTEGNFKKLQQIASDFSSGRIQEANKQLEQLLGSVGTLGTATSGLGEQVRPVFDEMSRAKEMSDDFEHLTWRLKYFFSLAGGFNLMRRAIRSAVTTTKELDAAMTQTAVVSTYTVSDMWKTLPKYSKEASKLGVAIKDVYNAQTLYVQQGLDMNTAMDLGVETMKMARVAGIGAEEATNSMTAALRGFNMAIDEKSAQRVNDVYSKLAQNTASNTQEISTAMTKTAALANSANMSFENTAAFLATIIESTREGAETAGTALKTVIARFTEVKSLYTKNQLTGTDEEGQEIDVNKISKALRTAGINMNEFFTGAKGLDEIFKELGSKWNNLSTVQQRYIATQAAGSRQQSRFLALMQNYERTVELTEMAYNSAGSGQEQFEKTLDSLAAKTEQLKNSWDTLLMGLANSDAIKGIVDFGTDILNVINKIIDALSGSSGLTKALATLSIGMGVFRAGRGAFGKGGLFSYLLGGKEISTRVSRTLMGGIVTSLKTAKTTPELGAAFGNTISNSFKRNFQLWGQGPNVGGQYLPKDQLEQLKADAKEYQTEINKINDQIKEREGYQEKIRNNSKINEEERESALKFNQKEIDNLNKQKQQTADEFAKKEEEKGFSNSTIRTAMTNPEEIQKTTVNYKALGNAALIAGAGFAALASYMKNTGKASQEAVASVEALSTGLTTMAMTMKLLQSVGSAVGGLSFLTGGWGLAIGAAVGAIVGIVKVVDELTESAEEKQKRINETISKNQTHIKDLENEYKQVDDSLGSIIQKQEDLNKLTEGTLAWKDAVKDLNTEIQTLVQNFPDLLEAVTIDKNGVWTINSDKILEIQKQKKEEINTTKSANLALEYTKTLSKFPDQFRPRILFPKDDAESALNSKLIELVLDSIDVNELSQTSITSLRNAKYSTLGEASENISWLKNLLWKRPLTASYVQELIDSGLSVSDFGKGLTINGWENLDFSEFSRRLENRKQSSVVSKELESITNSFITSYLMDQFDEKLPQNIYGGQIRKFILDYAKSIFDIRAFQISGLTDEEFENNKGSYYKALGFTQKNNLWYDSNNQQVQDKKYRDEVERWVVINNRLAEIDGIIDYFSEGLDDFKLGKLSLSEYRRIYEEEDKPTKAKGKGQEGKIFSTFRQQIADYYIQGYSSLLELQEELGYDSLFDDTITASTVNQVESIVRDAKNNYGKEAAIEVASFVESLYNSLLENGILNEDLFTGILSDIESGVITTIDQVEELTGAAFEGYDFEKIREILTKPISATSLIENFSDELSFLDSLRSEGKAFFTEEEKNKLLKIGKYTKDNFQYNGSGWILQNLPDNKDIAETYEDYLLNTTKTTYDSLTKGLERLQKFKTGRQGLTNVEGINNKLFADFMSQDFSKLDKNQIKTILKAIYGPLDSLKLYNPTTGKLVDYDNIDIGELTSTDLPWLFEANEYDLLSNQNILSKLLDSLNSQEGKLQTDTYSKLFSYIQGIKKTRSTEAGNSLMSQLLDWNELGAFDVINSEETINKFPEFLDTIGKLDWSNINSIEDFQKALDDQGIALNHTKDSFKELYNTFREIYKLGKIVTAEEIKQLAQYGLQLKNEIKNKTDASYTKEQRDYLVNAQKELADQFVYNAETGGYTYTGKKEVLEKVAQQAAVTTGYEQLWAEYILSQGNNADLDEYSQALKKLYNKEYWEDLTPEQQAQVEQFEAQSEYIKQNYEAATEGLKYAGLNNDQVRMEYGSSENQQIATTITDATKAGLNTQEFINYANTLKNITEQQKETQTLSDAMAYAIAYDNMLMNQGLQELASNFSTWKEALKLEGTPEYSAAIEGLRQSLQKLTGTTYKFTDEFLTSTEALDLFAKAAKGDVKALADLKKAAAKDIIKPDDLGEAGQKISDWINNLDLENIKIGAELETNVADVFQGLIDAGILTAEEVTSALESINYQPNVQMVPISGSAAAAAHTHAYLKSSTGGYTEIEGEENIAQQETVYVPVIGGSTKGNSYGLAPTVSKGGTGQTVTPPKGGGGGGGKKFKNDFDKYYNQVEDINELERQRNLLEKDYNQLLKSEDISGKDIYNNLKKQLNLLEKRKKLTADLAEKRKGQLFDAMKDEEYKDVWKYAKWNDEDQTIEIDWDAINKITDSEEGELVKEYVKKLEDFQGKYDDMINALEDIEDSIQEIKDRGKEQYSTLEERVRDALIKQIQDKIDELTEVDKAITDTNQKLFDSINQALELQRQERTNAETEEDLADKEQRLAYLQQDSSNANQVEIAKLQEELADARQDYTDNLIDQKISELQRQNDEATEQRQEQIELMQQSLDWQEKNGAFWAEVNSLIGKGVDEEGQLVHGSELEKLLKEGEAWDSLSTEGRMAWMSELEELVAQGIAYLSMTRQLEDLGVKSGTKVSFTTAGQKYTKSLDENDQVTFETNKGTVTGTKLKDSNKVEFRDSKGNIIGYGTVDEDGNVTFQESEGKTLTGTVDKDGNVIVKNADGSETVYKNVFQDYDGNYRTFEDYQPTGTTSSSDNGSGGSGDSGSSGRDQLDGHGWYTDENYHWHKTKSGKKVDYEKHNFMTINTSMAHGKQCKVCYYLKDWSDVGHEGTYTGDPADDNRPGRTTTSEGTRGFNGAAGTFDAKGNLIQFDDNGNVISTPKQADLDSLKEKPFATATYTSKGASSSDDYDRDYNEPETVYNDPLENELFNLGYNEEEIAYLESQGDSVEELRRKNLIPGFATGGLANFTGPAWLDGTRSNPELVLNARDTQNFIELKDTLTSLKSNGGLNLNGGDNYYDIKVQVDSLGSDYDVDKAIDRIKARIAQDNAYRNVNTLSRLR